MRQRVGAILTSLVRNRGEFWDYALYLPLALLFYLPLILGWASFEAGDFADHFLPFSQFLQSALSMGRLPLWNPYTYAGHPFLADVQAAVYYLPAHPFMMLGSATRTGAGQLYWLQWEAITHTALAGMGMHWLLRSLTGSRRAGAVAGLAFMLSGFITGYAPLQLAILRSAVWLPFTLAALWRAIHAPERMTRWVLSIVFGTLIILGGHGQTALYSLYALLGWVAVGLIYAHSYRREPDMGAVRTVRFWLSRLVGVFGTGLGVAGLGAAQLLPSGEFLGLSVRSNLVYEAASQGMPVRDTWQMALPGVFSQFSPVYIGIAGLILAVFGASAALWGRGDKLTALPEPIVDEGAPVPQSGRPIAGYFGLLTVLGLVVSYGENGRLFQILYEFAPGWDLFRGQERAAFLVSLGLAGLAGLGVAWLPVAGRTLRKRAALILGGIVTIVVYSFGVLYQLVGNSAVGDYFYLWIAFYTLSLGLLTCLLLWFDGWSSARSGLLALVLIVNLFIGNAGVNLDWVSPQMRVTLPREVVALQEAVETQLPSLPGRIYNEYRVTENYGMRAQLEDVWGASPLRLAHYQTLFDEFPLDRMWALLGVEYVLTWRRELFGPTELLAEFPQAADTTYLHRLPDVMPRAWLVESTVSALDHQAEQNLADHSVDLRTVAYLTPEMADAPQSVHTWAAGELSVLPQEGGRIHIVVDAPAPAFVVISENWMPGRILDDLYCRDALDVEINCEEAALLTSVPEEVPLWMPLRVNLTLTGVAVPAGRSEFVLDYRPLSVSAGLMSSGLTLVGLFLITIQGQLRRFRRREQSDMGLPVVKRIEDNEPS